MTVGSLRSKGIVAAISSAVFLGMSPVFGKLSILLGFNPLAIVALRTIIAVLLMTVFLVLYKRSFFYIYPLGLLGCLVAGFINGIGSILYYSGLARIDASIGQLLYSFYPLFVIFWLMLDRQSVSKMTLLRLGVSITGLFFLFTNPMEKIDILGIVFMLGAALLYALHIIINQRILFEVPAPTVTFYTLSSMALTVLIAFLFINPQLPPSGTPWWPLLILALITFLSRVTLFAGVKHLGGLQTAFLGLGEILVTIVLAQLFLGDRLSLIQWLGVFLICLNLLLTGYDQPTRNKRTVKGFLYWLNPPSIMPTEFSDHIE